MHKFVSLNELILPAEKSAIGAASMAALYGKGVFTTIAIHNFKPFLWGKHWRRLSDNAARLNIDLTAISEERALGALLRLIERNEQETGRARLTVYDGASSGIWPTESEARGNLLIMTAAPRETAEEPRLVVSPFPVNSASPLVNLKSCNYLENLLALEEALRRGGDEALRLNEKGEVVSASMANVFWVKDGSLYTPALETGCLAGTTREFLIENHAVSEVSAGLSEVFAADEMFLTSTGIGIRPAFFDGARRKPAEVGDKLNQLLDLQKRKE